MRDKKLSIGLRATLLILAVGLFVTSTWAATHESVLHRFVPNGGDGTFSQAGLITDAAGNRYGTTYQGGSYDQGTVFELTPTKGGGYAEKVLHSFNNNGTDGYQPYAGLVFAGGDLYGTTYFGGTYNAGTVFELTPTVGGGWAEKVLYSFNLNGTDGAYSQAALITDAAGNLYGTTLAGGTYYGGTVFELTPTGGGGWTEKVLYSFNSSGTDGYQPGAGLVFDAAGNLYGTTEYGGTYGEGTAFELTPMQGGGWTEKVLHNFGNSTDGAYLVSGLVFDAAGNLYGTTYDGGTHSVGTAFELTPTGGGNWTEKVLHNFNKNGTDGAGPYAGLIFDAAGNLYGTTSGGGTYNFGTVFELAPMGGGGWTEKVLRSFNFNGTDGTYPEASLIIDAAGDLYSTTYRGGTYSGGTAFELIPTGDGSWTEKILHSFNFNGTDGAFSQASLISDAAGNLYGTTSEGGTRNFGMVFELTPSGGGGWTEKVLYNFGNGTDGALPFAGLVFDAAGNLYGTTFEGGTYDVGTVFELTPKRGGGWTERVLHNFGNGTDGAYLFAGLIFDVFGNLYGTTYQGGTHNWGTVFELTPTGSGSWTEKVLHSFNNNGTDGFGPYAGLIFDAGGDLYGTTAYGGTYYSGTVFELTPTQGGWAEQVLHNFGNGTDGAQPQAGLVFDVVGNLYGTTFYGGTYGGGTVFELSRSGGGWAEQLPHSFNNDGTDGAYPESGLVLFGASANLYGTTSAGGTNNAGTVFELTPTQGGSWIEAILHNFNSTDGSFPYAGMIFDAAGNLYGTTVFGGGTYNSGTVFEIGP